MSVMAVILLLSFCVKNTIEWSPASWFENSEGCEIDLNSDINHDREPVFFTKQGSQLQLAMPKVVNERGVFTLSKDERFYVACPGRRNELQGFSSEDSQPLESKCVKNKTLRLEGKDLTTSELECKSKVSGVLKELNTPCGGRSGKLIQLGFDVGSWHPLVTLCYRSDRTETLYSTHVLHGAALQGALSKKRQNYFVKGNTSRSIYAGVNPESAYRQTNQREVLSQLLGEASTRQIMSQSYISKGHLSPVADFLLGTWQDISNFYINTAPQWQTINGGNWVKVENLIRRLASHIKRDLSVTTGTFSVLELKDENEVLHKIYLVPQKRLMPVPILFWKILEDKDSNSCIVFVVHNNPFLDRASIQELSICKNICNDYGWPTDMNNVSKGFTYCCSFKEFKKVVDTAPDLGCKNILRNL